MERMNWKWHWMTTASLQPNWLEPIRRQTSLCLRLMQKIFLPFRSVILKNWKSGNGCWLSVTRLIWLLRLQPVLWVQKDVASRWEAETRARSSRLSRPMQPWTPVIVEVRWWIRKVSWSVSIPLFIPRQETLPVIRLQCLSALLGKWQTTWNSMVRYSVQSWVSRSWVWVILPICWAIRTCRLNRKKNWVPWNPR